jgi:hypothetical protein
MPSESVHFAHAHTVVRVEGEESVGRAYSAKLATIPGIGAKRRALHTKSFRPYEDGSSPVLESCTMAQVNCATATRADLLEYFRNTWATTDTVFGCVLVFSVF